MRPFAIGPCPDPSVFWNDHSAQDMTHIKPFRTDACHEDILCLGEPDSFLSMRQMDIKPMLKVLAGLCLFFGALAVAVGCGAIMIMLIRSLARLL